MKSGDCDEKRSFTPEPHMSQIETISKKDSRAHMSQSMIGAREANNVSQSSIRQASHAPIMTTGGINTVYKSTQMELSKYIN